MTHGWQSMDTPPDTNRAVVGRFGDGSTAAVCFHYGETWYFANTDERVPAKLAAWHDFPRFDYSAGDPVQKPLPFFGIVENMDRAQKLEPGIKLQVVRGAPSMDGTVLLRVLL